MPKVPATIKFNDMVGWEFSPDRFVMEDGKIYSRDSVTKQGIDIEPVGDDSATFDISQNTLQVVEDTKITIELLKTPEREATQALERAGIIKPGDGSS